MVTIELKMATTELKMVTTELKMVIVELMIVLNISESLCSTSTQAFNYDKKNPVRAANQRWNWT